MNIRCFSDGLINDRLTDWFVGNLIGIISNPFFLGLTEQCLNIGQNIDAKCVINTPAPPNKAVNCYNTFGTPPTFGMCHGAIVNCTNPESPFCKNPDNSYDSCIQAPKTSGGWERNCEGY